MGLSKLSVSALAVAAALASSGAGAAVPDRALGALGEDDACASSSSSGACAMQALQQRSAKGLLTESPDPAPAAATGAVSSNPWIWDEEVIKAGYVFPVDKPDFITNTFASPITEIVSFFCTRWLSYNWVKAAFWGQEVLRRTEALPATPSAEQQAKLQGFAKKASFLACIYDFDPQLGTNWSSHASDFMRQVGKAPSTSLDMPQLDEWFARSPQSVEMFSMDACMFWVESNMCDLGYLGKALKGNKDYRDGICWDEVERQEYTLTLPFNTSIDLPFNLNILAQDDDFNHPEFDHCQEHPFTRELVQDNCPMFGHYPKGMWGMGEDFSWGSVPEPGTQKFDEVLSCSSKLGVPAAAKMDYWDFFPYADNMGLMGTPGWRVESIKYYADLLNNSATIVENRARQTLDDLERLAFYDTNWTAIANTAAQSESTQKAWALAGSLSAKALSTQATNLSSVYQAYFRAMTLTNFSGIASASGAVFGVMGQTLGKTLGAADGMTSDIIGEALKNLNKTIFEVNWSNDTLFDGAVEDLSIVPVPNLDPDATL